MNILIDELPNTIEISHIEYLINTDFRIVLQILLAFEDNELTGLEKQMVLLKNLYPVIPDNVHEALRLADLFLNGGKEQNEEITGPRIYSFSKDANLIYAAFQQTHGIDLQHTEYMHWWQFLALFMDLGIDTAFCQLVSLRKRVKTGKATREEYQMARDMGEIFDIPELDNRTLEEKEQEAEFMQLINSASQEK